MFLSWISVVLLLIETVAGQKSLSKSTGPPPFFLQDATDGLCLGGAVYRRCSLNTLWYVTGKPGSYQVHHRQTESEDDETCLSKSQCHLESSSASLMNCNHCGAKKWNIVGDSETGVILSDDCSMALP